MVVTKCTSGKLDITRANYEPVVGRFERGTCITMMNITRTMTHLQKVNYVHHISVFLLPKYMLIRTMITLDETIYLLKYQIKQPRLQ